MFSTSEGIGTRAHSTPYRRRPGRVRALLLRKRSYAAAAPSYDATNVSYAAAGLSFNATNASYTTAEASNTGKQAPEWVWDSDAQDFRYWSGTQCVAMALANASNTSHVVWNLTEKSIRVNQVYCQLYRTNYGGITNSLLKRGVDCKRCISM